MPAYAPLIPDLKECCDTHYGWNHAECMGVVSGPSNKFFPNWGAQPNICLFDDGSNTVPVGAPLISDLKECCDTHYGWNHDECMGVVQGPSNKYFPNWGGSPNICLFDDGSNTVPAGVPLFDDLKACCNAHYGWNHDQCMGVVQGPSNKYFPNWSSSVGPHICLFDDGSNAGPNGAPLFDSLSLCCTTHYSWNKNECLGIVTTPAPPSMNFFPDWAGANLGCIQDDGSNAVPDYMKGATSPYMYPTNDACCDARYSWRADECKLT